MAKLDGPVRPRALIVDCDDGFLAFAAEALHSFRPGFEVATARTLDQAGEWLETFHPDLLLLGADPDNDATASFRKRVAADPRTKTCKVMVYPSDPAGRPAELPVLLQRVRDTSLI